MYVFLLASLFHASLPELCMHFALLRAAHTVHRILLDLNFPIIHGEPSGRIVVEALC
jgi:hypothetical protein